MFFDNAMKSCPFLSPNHNMKELLHLVAAINLS